MTTLPRIKGEAFRRVKVTELCVRVAIFTPFAGMVKMIGLVNRVR